jgi:microcystin-dependent protein
MADSFIGEIRMVAFNYAPAGWAVCDGSTRTRADYPELFDLLGSTYGGDGTTTFGLPDLQARIPIGDGQGDGLTGRRLGESGGQEAVAVATTEIPGHGHEFLASPDDGKTHDPGGALIAKQGGIDLYLIATEPNQQLHPAAVSVAGGSQPHDNIQKFLVLGFVISLKGDSPRGPAAATEPDPFLGEVRLMGRDKPPNESWAACDGLLLAVSQNTALFSLLSSVFGGNGTTTFGLPDLREAVAMDAGPGRGLSDRYLGETGGEPDVTLTQRQMPEHTHALLATSNPGEVKTPAPNTALARSSAGNAYQTNAGRLVQMDPAAITSAGGSQAHTNMQPYLALRYMIAVQGRFPNRE